MAFSTKSSLDMVTEPSSENESDSEIENDLNHDDETVPEYDILDTTSETKESG